ncbi:hypothetical protein D9M71_666960 [compost metagenome]
MTGGAGQRAILPPASHATINQGRIARLALFGAQPQALHDPRAHAFDQHIGTFDQLENHLTALSGFQVRHHRTLAAVKRVARGIFRTGDRGGRLALHSDHISAEIRQMHRAKRSGADTADFNDPDT